MRQNPKVRAIMARKKRPTTAQANASMLRVYTQLNAQAAARKKVEEYFRKLAESA